MERTAQTALEILRDVAIETHSSDTSTLLHTIANTLEQEIIRLETLVQHESIIAIKRWATAARALEALPENAYLDPDKMDQLLACLVEVADAKTELFKTADQKLMGDSELRLVSYAPDYSTCTLNIDGEEHYYDRTGTK